MGVFSCLISYYFSGPRIIDFLFIGLSVANPQGHAQPRNEKQHSILSRKKTKWRADFPVGIACPFPLAVEPIFKGRGWGISYKRLSKSYAYAKKEGKTHRNFLPKVAVPPGQI